MEKAVEIVGQGHEGVVRLPSLEISSKDNEVYSLGEVPKETWSLVKQLEQKIDDKGYAMVEQAEMSVRASCSLKRATYALISSRQCDAGRLNKIFELEMRLGKCLDRCKIALIKYDSTCDDVLECSTIGFMYAIEGHQSRACVKFQSARTKAEDIKSVFQDVNSVLNEVSNEMKEMRTDIVAKQSDADNKEEEKKKTVDDAMKLCKAKMTGLDAAISDLEQAWFPDQDSKREKDRLKGARLILGQNLTTAQTEEEKASAFNTGIDEAMGAFKKIEAGLQRQESFWDSISLQYEKIVDKLKELDEDSNTAAMNDLLSSTAFKYDALVTHCWFQAMRNCLKPTKHLLSECVNRLYRNITDHPTNPSAARANLEQMMAADDEEIKQLLKEWKEFNGNSDLEAVEAATAEKPTVRRRTKPLESEPRPLSPPSQPAPAPAASSIYSFIVSLEQFRVRIALFIVLFFAVLVLLGGSSKK